MTKPLEALIADMKEQLPDAQKAWIESGSTTTTIGWIYATNPTAMSALIAALEQAQTQSSKWLEAYHKAASIGARYEERIAELEASQLAVKLPEQYPDDGDLLFSIDLHDEPDMNLQIAIWLKELRRRRAGTVGGE